MHYMRNFFYICANVINDVCASFVNLKRVFAVRQLQIEATKKAHTFGVVSAFVGSLVSFKYYTNLAANPKNNIVLNISLK